MQKIVFAVQGSGSEPYEVVFHKAESALWATCTCMAGAMGQFCKHRISILNGSKSDIVSGNESEIPVVISWLPGSNIATAMSVLADAEAELEIIKKRVTAAKKHLSAAMRP